jgi:hypothetical protein
VVTKINLISKKRVLELLKYEDGRLYWKVNRGGTARAGSEAGADSWGVRYILVDGKRFATHRLVFLIHNGYLPQYVDHIDRNPLNNHIENLREATNAENAMNCKVHSSNSSGARGVTYDSGRGKWRASMWIVELQNSTTIGRFDTFEEARDAAHSARVARYGEFVPEIGT